MKWLRYRDHHSANSAPWVYRPLFVDEVTKEHMEILKEDMEMKAEEWNWSEHFRGIEWDVISTSKVPNTKIVEARESMMRSIKYHNSEVRRLNGQIPKVEKLIGKGRKTDPDEIEKKQREKRYQKTIAEVQKRNIKAAKDAAEVDKGAGV